MSLMTAAAVQTAPPAHSREARILPIEGVRGLAVFLVFFVHLHPFFAGYLRGHAGWYRASEMLAALGNAGVDLFFLLSGFLIYGIVLKHTRSYWDFIRRRIRRIYPVFAAVLALYLFLSLLLPAESKLRGTALAQAIYVVENFFLLPGIFPIRPIITVAWSLSYEFFFYLTIPLIVRGFALGQLQRLQRVGLLAGWYVAGLVLLHPLGLERLQMFCLGMLLYELSTIPSVVARMSSDGEWVALAAFAGALVCAYFAFASEADVNVPALFAKRLAFPLMSIGFFIFGAYSFVFTGFLSRFFSTAPLRALGHISYSYYLIHGLTLRVLKLAIARVIPWNGPAVFCAISIGGFALTCITATIMFVLIEEPLSLHGQSTLSRYWQKWGSAWKLSPALDEGPPPAQ